MNYEEKYKAAIELARDYHKANLKLNKADENLILEDIFPELAESDDERIRKWIINEIKIKHHNLDEDNVDFVDKAIAWLEKLKVFAEHGDGLYYFGNNSFTYVDNPTWYQKPFDYENATIIQKDFAPKKGGEHNTEV